MLRSDFPKYLHKNYSVLIAHRLRFAKRDARMYKFDKF